MTEKKLSAVEKRQKQQKELLIEQLKKTPIIQLAAEKVGTSRATFYRWRHDDLEFAQEVDKALSEGVELVSDMAESQLMSAIRDGNMTGIMFWLKHRKKDYNNKLELSGKVKTEHSLSEEQQEAIKRALELSSLVPGDEINN